MSDKKFKVGDMVKVTRSFSDGEGKGHLTWMPHSMNRLIGTTGKITEINFNDQIQLDHSWWFYPHVLEHVKPHAARILTEKVTIEGVPCRKILGFEGILGCEELPPQYVSGRPAFWSCGIKEGHGHFNFRDGRMHYNGCNDSECIDVNLPRDASPEIDTNGGFLLLHEGDTWPEATFQNILIWLKRAGFRLAKIRKQEKAAWSGKEAVEI